MKIAVVFIMIIGLMACANDNNQKHIIGWTEILNRHLEKYPKMQTADIYKLVYQGILGPAHLGVDAELIRKYLIKEMSGIEADANVQLVENISPDSLFVRVNLMKFKSLVLPVDILVRSIVNSSTNQTVDRKTFKKIWKRIKKRVEAGQIHTDPVEFLKFHQFIAESNYPVVHHSESYFRYYSPAYRVVLKSVWEENTKHYLN